MNITVKKDWDGYLAEVAGQDSIYAFAYTEKEALMELYQVLEMLRDYHIEQLSRTNTLLHDKQLETYAV